MIPLILKLKKQAHKDIAKAQDLIVETLYSVFNEAVLHGGTSIWRCYQGARFSEDIDAYLSKDLKKISLLFEKLEQKSFIIEKKKIGENSLYSTLRFGSTLVRFEALFKKTAGHLKEYETAEGNFLTVLTLTPEELVQEKIQTYLKRRKIRDLYDLFFLLRLVQDRENIKKQLKPLLEQFQEPVDEDDLKIIILEGLVPDTEKMREYIQNWG